MKQLAYLLLALAALLSIASHLAPDARAQGTLAYTTANPRTWPPRPEDMVHIEVLASPDGTFQDIQPGEEVQLYLVPPTKWLVLQAGEVGATGPGPFPGMFASRTSSSGERELSPVAHIGSLYNTPLGWACSPGARVFIRNAGPGVGSWQSAAFRGYLVDVIP